MPGTDGAKPHQLRADTGAPTRRREKVGQGQTLGQAREAWNPERLPPPAPGPLPPAAARGSPHRQRTESDTGRRCSGPGLRAQRCHGGAGGGRGRQGRPIPPGTADPAGSQDGGGRSRSPARRRPPSPGGRAAPGTAARPREAAGNAAPGGGPAPGGTGHPAAAAPLPSAAPASPLLTFEFEVGGRIED